MKKTILSIALIAFLLSCSSVANDQKASKVDAVANVQLETTSIASYMKLKDAFVKSDIATAQTAATELSVSLKAEGMDVKIIDAANLIASSSNLEEQRTAFKTITDGLIESIKEEGTDVGVYVQHCPMAFDNSGANWLSMSDEIRNPYFGDMMLKCGRVEEKL